MDDSVQRAIRDIEIIRRAIEQAERSNSGKVGAQQWELKLQVGLISAGLVTIVFERLTHQSEMLLASSGDTAMRIVGVVTTALSLVMLAAIFHLLVKFAAQQSAIEHDSFISRQFTYLRNFSLFSDLAVKFMIFALVIFARVPILVAPLFSIYIADYLFQGRLFVLPLRASMTMGALCIAAAGAQFFLESGDLLWPLCLFLASSVSSALYLSRRGTSAGSAE